MQTPIYDFVNQYIKSEPLRLHMPGHKGNRIFGIEPYDITEIDGADSLYEATGIIAESEKNAGELFGADTFYSTEGSSLAIRAMLYLAVLDAKERGRKPLIAAFRNAHRVFVSAAALIDFDILWLQTDADSYLSCNLTPKELEEQLLLAKEKPNAVYITCPDYLGTMADIEAMAKICHKYDVLLLVDNAHGAYLKFLPESKHPMDLGADMCCDSAHKTLPVLTGGAYLHIAKGASPLFAKHAKTALSLFGSTSPSYLILQSLDIANHYLGEGYREKLSAFLVSLQECKNRLISHGYHLIESEPLKLTISAKQYGYEGNAFKELLKEQGIVCEFSDPDFVVLMLTPEIGKAGLERLEKVLSSILQRPAISKKPPQPARPEKVMSIREAMFLPCETVKSEDSLGRVLALDAIGCPPAIPIVVCGERIDQTVMSVFSYYGIDSCTVVKCPLTDRKCKLV